MTMHVGPACVAFQYGDLSESSMMTLAVFQKPDTLPAILSFEDDTLCYDDYATTHPKNQNCYEDAEAP